MAFVSFLLTVGAFFAAHPVLVVRMIPGLSVLLAGTTLLVARDWSAVSTHLYVVLILLHGVASSVMALQFASFGIMVLDSTEAWLAALPSEVLALFPKPVVPVPTPVVPAPAPVPTPVVVVPVPAPEGHHDTA